MNSSPQINELATALAKAQGEITHAKKDAENPFFKSKYADLAAVLDVSRVPLSKNGLAVLQILKTENESVKLLTILTHSSGQWIESEAPVKPVKPDPQSLGSAITYMRRYMFMAMVGIATEDDDGNEGSSGNPKEPSVDRVKLVDLILKEGERVGISGKDILKHIHPKAEADLTTQELNALLAWVRAQKDPRVVK